MTGGKWTGGEISSAESHRSGTAQEYRGQRSRNGKAASSGTQNSALSSRDGTRERGTRPGTGGLGGGRPASTLPESPPGSERGSVRVNTAATAANTATLPRRPPEPHGPARAAGSPPSPWRPMGPDARQLAHGAHLPNLPGREARAARGGFRSSREERTMSLPARRGRRK